MRSITCLNNNKNLSITFNDKFSPFLLQKVEGLYTVSNKINTTENSTTDGSTFNSSQSVERNIVIYLADRDVHAKNRRTLYNLFTEGNIGTLIYHDDDGIYPVDLEINYYVEKIDFDSLKRVRKGIISLVCTDPYFYGVNDIIVNMSAWVKQFEFPHEFKLEELGYYTAERIKRIENDSTDDVPLTISIYADGDVKNPILTHVEKNEVIAIGWNGLPFSMVRGDELIITTAPNNKNIYFNGVKANNRIRDDTVFFTLQSGLNTLHYSADEGIELMQVKIVYREKFPGA